MRPARTANGLALWLAVLACAAAAGCAADKPCSTEQWPAASGPTVYVATCGDDGASGTRQAPLRTLAAAATRAKPGQTVALAAGSYRAGISWPGGVALVGVDLTDADGASVLTADQGPAALRITSDQTTRLSNLRIDGAVGSGLLVEGGSIEANHLDITGVSKVAGAGGHGVELQEVTSATLLGLNVHDNAGTGLVAYGGGEVTILDPSFVPSDNDPPAAAVQAAVADPAFAPASRFTGNKGGGVAFVRPQDAAGILDPSFLVGRTLIANNAVFGLGSWGVVGQVEQSRVVGNGDDNDAFGDGVVVLAAGSGKPAVRIGSNTVVDANLRAGAVVGSDATLDVRGRLEGNGRSGAWAQGPNARLMLADSAVVRANVWLGVGVSTGAELLAGAALIADTLPLQWAPPDGGLPGQIADGVGVFAGSRAELTGTVLQGNGRAGLLAANPAASDGVIRVALQSVAVSDCPLGLVLVAGSAGKTPDSWQSGVSFSAVQTPVDLAAKLAVTSQICASDACLPTLW